MSELLRGASHSISPEDITELVVSRYDECADPRLREVMQALIRHLHGFAIEVGLSEDERRAAIRILTESGHITDDVRQEFVLWSDATGMSMLVDAIAHPKPTGATESTVLGPWYVPNSPMRSYGENMAEGEPIGTPAWMYGRVLDLDGNPIAGALLDVWQNDADELYAVQNPEGPEDHLRGRYISRPDGTYAILGVRPTPYPIPYDGPVGRMLDATGRHAWRPAHFHLIVSAGGFETVTTHIFDSASEYLDTDAVFAVKPSLVREFVLCAADAPNRPPGVHGEWYSVASDIVLVPSE